ncbi:MAG: SemiSWEET transporter [Bacteroidota bacterium]|mgnify:FL=1|nr:SemiSWEET transporter [Bacteroidota bacterium]MEC9135304.1 SemiSWEET transporter [Bacteroidota bacterium]|tara:strand:- start:286 stop:555 length:270 start_codon:yes stop_codon:yes gene_type:complete
MSDFQIEIIGLIAAAFTTIAFVPQVIKISKKRTAKGVSITMYVIMFVGICFWFCYGVLIDSISVITANLISGILQLFIIIFALIHRNNN